VCGRGEILLLCFEVVSSRGKARAASTRRRVR
jgi:hypothetical protein